MRFIKRFVVSTKQPRGILKEEGMIHPYFRPIKTAEDALTVVKYFAGIGTAFSLLGVCFGGTGFLFNPLYRSFFSYILFGSLIQAIYCQALLRFPTLLLAVLGFVVYGLLALNSVVTVDESIIVAPAMFLLIARVLFAVRWLKKHSN